MKVHSESPSPLTGEFVKDSQSIRRRKYLHQFVAIGTGVLLLLMIILQQTSYLHRLIYQPLDMNNYWVIIPAGEFQMGSENGYDDEGPVHTVYVDAFEMGRYEITTRQYTQCIKAKVCAPSEYDKDLFPVVNITWYGAKAYCEWVGGRLPTEAEWEKAASWDDKTKIKRTYPWGENIDCSFANYYGEDKGNRACAGSTTPVGSYENGKSYYGIYDMAGNVWEWTSSLYQAYPYRSSDGREDLSLSGNRVVRGGSWFYNDLSVRSTDRIGYPSAEAYDLIGFRCARSLVQ
jgi:formylglycine-generating enzyme required for sulfatase activity